MKNWAALNSRFLVLQSVLQNFSRNLFSCVFFYGRLVTVIAKKSNNLKQKMQILSLQCAELPALYAARSSHMTQQHTATNYYS